MSVKPNRQFDSRILKLQKSTDLTEFDKRSLLVNDRRFGDWFLKFEFRITALKRNGIGTARAQADALNRANFRLLSGRKFEERLIFVLKSALKYNRNIKDVKPKGILPYVRYQSTK